MPDAKQTLFLASWAVGIVSLVSMTLHCWSTRAQKQPWLLASKITLAASVALALPYTWNLDLARYRLLGNMTVFVICAVILASAFV